MVSPQIDALEPFSLVELARWFNRTVLLGDATTFEERLRGQMWMTQNPQFPVAAITLYLILTFSLPRVFVKSGYGDGFNVKREFFLWNITLSIFSMIGLYSLSGGILKFLKVGLGHTVCQSMMHTVTDTEFFAGTFFVMSKFIELGDTIFLILLKPSRPVQTLQWYHHATVLAFCWVALVNNFGAGYLFCYMNYFVHSFMYLYFALTYFISPKSMVYYGNFITTIQVLQMVLGTVINFAAVYYRIEGYTTFVEGEEKPCQVTDQLIFAGALMYLSYLYLFGQIFIQKICKMNGFSELFLHLLGKKPINKVE